MTQAGYAWLRHWDVGLSITAAGCTLVYPDMAAHTQPQGLLQSCLPPFWTLSTTPWSSFISVQQNINSSRDGEDDPQGKPSRTSLVILWLRTHLSIQEAWVQLPVREFRSHRLWGSWARAPQLESPFTTTKTQSSQKGKDPGPSLPGACYCAATPQPQWAPPLEMLTSGGSLRWFLLSRNDPFSERLGHLPNSTSQYSPVPPQGTYKSMKLSYLSIVFLLLGCHLHENKISVLYVLFLCVRAQSLQSCLTLCNPVHHSPPGSSIHEILQARILEWLAMPSSRETSQPRDQTHIGR